MTSGMSVNNDTNIMYGQEVIVNLRCPMKFNHYPFDTQNCFLVFGSFSQEAHRLQFFLGSLTSEEITKQSVLDYSIQVRPIQEGDDRPPVMTYNGQNFSIAGIKIELQRKTTKYLINYYLPPTFFVVVSWV
jgi:hypothetical protein